MVYSIKTGDRRGFEYRAIVLQWYCNRVDNAGGGVQGGLIRAQRPRSKIISCKGQLARLSAERT